MNPKNMPETETYQRNLIRTVLFNLNKKRTNLIVVHHTFSKVFDIATSLFMRGINFYFQQQYCAFKDRGHRFFHYSVQEKSRSYNFQLSTSNGFIYTSEVDDFL